MQNFRNYFQNLDFSPPKYSKVLDSRDAVSSSTNFIISLCFCSPSICDNCNGCRICYPINCQCIFGRVFLRIKLASNRELFKDGPPKIWASKIAYWWPYWHVHLDATAYSSANTRRKSGKFAFIKEHIGRHFRLWFHCLCHFVCHFFRDWAR